MSIPDSFSVGTTATRVGVFVGVFVGVLVGVLVGVFVGVVIGAVARKSPDCDVVRLLPEAKSAGTQVLLGQKKSWICDGLWLATIPVNCPTHVEVPAPSDTVPAAGSVIVVPVADLVSKRGDPAKREQESPMLSAAQLRLADPGPTAVAV